MAITQSGLYYPTLEKQLIDTAGLSIESETAVKVAMVTDSYTPNFDTHDFFNDAVANEVADSLAVYVTGGKLITSTELTTASGLATFDAADVSWLASTISNAMAAIGKFVVGSDATDMMIFLSDFVTAASTVNGTFTIQWSGSGIYTIDFA